MVILYSKARTYLIIYYGQKLNYKKLDNSVKYEVTKNYLLNQTQLGLRPRSAFSPLRLAPDFHPLPADASQTIILLLVTALCYAGNYGATIIHYLLSPHYPPYTSSTSLHLSLELATFIT